MEWLIEHRNALEVLYFLSGIILALASGFVAFQVYIAKGSFDVAIKAFNLAKTDSNVRLRREAIVIAANRCEQYAKEILPLLGRNVDDIGTLGISNNVWKLENNFLDESSIKDWNAANEWLSKLRQSEISNETVRLLNILESFAIYFVKGAADEQVAYPSIGISFCEHIDGFAPYLILLRQQKIPGQTSGPFQNIATLYKIWSDRISKEALQIESNKISEKMSRIPSSGIPPVGL